MTESLYISTSESGVSSADVWDTWSTIPFWEICPYTWADPPPLPGMMQWDSSGVLASWLEPVVEGTPLTWPVLVEPLALLGERLFGGGRWCWITLVGGAGGAKWAGNAAYPGGIWVSVDWDKALVGLGHGHGRPCWNCTHLSRRGNSLGWVEVPRGGGSSGSIAWVAKAADGAGAERGGLSGGVASSSRGRAGAGVGRQPLPSSQAGVNILEARPTCWSFLPALCHQTIKPKSQQSYFITTNSNNQTASKTLFELNTLN